jgi:predicted small lipoprotein YifL
VHFQDHDVRVGKKLTGSTAILRPMFLRPKFLLLMLVALLASSCGLKGPLYRPDESRNGAVTPTDDPAAASKKKQSSPPVQPPDPDRPAVPPKH